MAQYAVTIRQIRTFVIVVDAPSSNEAKLEASDIWDSPLCGEPTTSEVDTLDEYDVQEIAT